MKKKIFISIWAFLTPFIWAQAQGPTAPEAASFEPVDATDMVNLLTGDFSYVLPVINVPSPEGGYPLALSYHSGITLEQEASWVGLGWSLNPGAINRSVSGVPDDWKDKVRSVISDDIGGQQVSNSLFLGISLGKGSGSASIGLNASWGSHKAFGGETTYNFSIGGAYSVGYKTYSIGVTNSGDFSIGYSNGVENYSYSTTDGFGYGWGINYGGLTLDIGVTQKSGLGISLSSMNGIYLPIVGNQSSESNSGGGSLSYSGSSIMTGIYGKWFNIRFSRQNIRYWHYDEKTYTNTGALYAGKIDEVLSDKLLPYLNSFDANESIARNLNQYAAENNPTSINYDQYGVSAQGLSGSITPHLFDTGYLHQDLKVFNKNNVTASGIEVELNSLWYYMPDSFSKYIGSSTASENINFDFNGEYSSYYRTETDPAWSYPSSISGIQDFMPNVSIGSDDFHDGFNGTNNRIKRSSYVESYTNGQILANSNLILDDYHVNRNNLDPDGIGAFKITVADGKTYHYSLPVYQKEMFTRTAKKDDNINEKYFESQSLSPYATHWLLTAITGPDFVDINNNGTMDESDYGYWVRFDYGKWSDGYGWKNPKTDYSTTVNSKTYSWGVKEVYYLDRIETRTHTAFFVKEDRPDARSTFNQVGQSRSQLLYKDAVYRSWDPNVPKYVGTDGKIYYPGAYSVFSPEDLDNPHNGNLTTVITNGFYANSIGDHKSLRLKEIILMRNEDVPSGLSKQNSVDPGPRLVSDFLFQERVQMDYSNGGGYHDTGFFTYHDESYNGEYYGNVYNQSDLEVLSSNMRNDAVRVIELGFDNSLALNTPNSGSGRTTLKKVIMKGKNGIQLIPAYDFDYYNNVNYDRDLEDNWGFIKNNPENWSLKEITTPVGAKLEVTYESDVFNEVAVVGTVFEDNIQVRFLGQDVGPKQLEIRNDPANTPVEDVDFRDYFETGLAANVDVQFWNNPNGGGDHKQADVAKYCMVESVAQNSVVFTLPSSGVNPDVRRDNATCQKTDWVFYRRFNDNGDGVVEKGWQSEENEGDCADPGNGNSKTRYRIVSNKVKENQVGGGLRVAQITLHDDVNASYATNYSYDNPLTGVNSGVTVFAPSTHEKEIPYIEYLPTPSVLYEYVTVDNNETTSEYKFKVPKSFTITNGDYFLDDILSITSNNVSSQTIPGTGGLAGTNVPINTEQFIIQDNISHIGSLLSRKVVNSVGQVVSETINNYRSSTANDYGVVKESFNTAERLYGFNYNSNTFTTLGVNLSNTSVVKLSNVLESTEVVENGFKTVIDYLEYDKYTGQVVETGGTMSDGTSTKSQVVYAFNKYPEMGSKVDDPTNRNMLAQQSANYTLIDDGGIWRPINVGITTWSNDWSYRDFAGNESSPTNSNEKIWRKQRTYIWDGEIDNNGAFVGYDLGTDDGFDWSISATEFDQPEQWKLTSHTVRYDHFSKSLETRLPNSVSGTVDDHYYSAVRTDYGKTNIVAQGNTKLTEFYFSGVEDINSILGIDYIGHEVSTNGNRSQTVSHTGGYSLKLNQGEYGFKTVLNANEHRDGTYKLSIWVHKDNYGLARVSYNNGPLENFNGEKVYAGDWVLMNHYVDLTTSNEVLYVGAAGNDVYFDDFRLHPIESNMITYVYNDFDELTHILGPNNLASQYNYDNEGRLVAVYNETVDGQTLAGGFKLAQDYQYNFKRGTELGVIINDPLPPLSASFNGINTGSLPNSQCGSSSTNCTQVCKYFSCEVQNLVGGSGNYSFEWQFRTNVIPAYGSPYSSAQDLFFTYNYEISQYCDPLEGYGWIQFKCTVTDDDPSVDPLVFESNQLSFNCTCGDQ